jgi:Peptidase family S41
MLPHVLEHSGGAIKHFISFVIFISCFSAHAQNSHSEREWAHTKFSFSYLQAQVLNDTVCAASDRNYLGCVKAIDALLNGLGYKLSTPDRSSDLGYTAAKTISNFQLLKFVGFDKNLNSLTALKLIREKNRIDEDLWIKQKPLGFAALFAEISKMLNKKSEKSLSAKAVNAFLAEATDPHTYFTTRTQWQKKSIVTNVRSNDSDAKISSQWLDKVAYIKVSSFLNPRTCSDFNSELKKYAKSSALIIDLRSNGGGLVDQVRCLLADFLPTHSLLVNYENPISNEVIGEDHTERAKISYPAPVAVLVDQFSASGAELMAGVLQDYHRADIVGVRTFGKGTMQKCELAPELGQTVLCHTIARFHLPSGRSNQVVGITPDFEAYPDKTPTAEEQLTFREAEIHRYPIRPGPFVATSVDPRPSINACVEHDIASIEDDDADYAAHVAQSVVKCRGL